MDKNKPGKDRQQLTAMGGIDPAMVKQAPLSLDENLNGDEHEITNYSDTLKNKKPV